MSTQSNLLQTSFASGFKVFLLSGQEVFTTKEHLHWSYRASLYNNFTIFLKKLVMNMDQILGSSSWFTNKLGRKWVIHGIKRQ
jgi:hypothetical protein